MTREEAIECLSERVSIGKTCEQSCMVGFGVNINTLDEALDMAISALRQQEPVTNRNGLNDPMTNAQKIRSMSDEELAVLIAREIVHVPHSGFYVAKSAWLRWLHETVEEQDG